ncbi:hypothetical protein IWQ57_006284, partial [Coemansia nantahalensis]
RRRRTGRTPVPQALPALSPPPPPPPPRSMPPPLTLLAANRHGSPPSAAPLQRPDTMQGRILGGSAGPLSPMLPPQSAVEKPKTAYSRSPLRRGLSIRSWFHRQPPADEAAPPVPKTPTIESPRPHSHK